MPPRVWQVIALLLILFALAACGAAAPRGGAISVVASIMPLADWAREVGGERVAVQLLVPPARNPRTYVPTDQQRRAVERADVVLLNGLGLEPWLEAILEETRTSRLVVLEIAQFTGPLTERVTRRYRPLPPDPDIAPGPRQRAGSELSVPAPVYSSYLWLDPTSAMYQVDLIAYTLARVDKAGLSYYRQNAARYNGELENLDASVFRQSDTWTERTVVVSNRFLHPFARRYNLDLVLISDPNRNTGTAQAPLVLDQLASARAEPGTLPADAPALEVNALAGATYIELMQTNVHSITLVLAGR